MWAKENKIAGSKGRQNLCYIVYRFKTKNIRNAESFKIPDVRNVYLLIRSVVLVFFFRKNFSCCNHNLSIVAGEH